MNFPVMSRNSVPLSIGNFGYSRAFDDSLILDFPHLFLQETCHPLDLDPACLFAWKKQSHSDRIIVVKNLRGDFPRRFRDEVGKPVRERVRLRDHSNFRIGGPADYFFEANSVRELKSSFRIARECRVPFYVIGGGFNLLFDDEGFRGLIIKNSVRGMEWDGPNGLLKAAAGTTIWELVDFTSESGLEGFEFLAGIPGTVGGAVFGNAGAFGQGIGDFFEDAALLKEDGKEFRVSQEYLAFGYRHSRLKVKHEFLLEADFRLRPGDKGEIRARINGNLAARAKKHPPRDTACAGSFFKNPIRPDGTKASAGRLLEQAGARELEIGGAAVYSGHCNFLVNAHGATARDVLDLAAELKKRVREKFGIELEEEVMFLRASASGL